MDPGKWQKRNWAENNLVFLSGTKQITLFTSPTLLHRLKDNLGVPPSPSCSADIKYGSEIIATYFTLFMMSLHYLKPKLEHCQCCSWPTYMSVWCQRTDFVFQRVLVLSFVCLPMKVYLKYLCSKKKKTTNFIRVAIQKIGNVRVKVACETLMCLLSAYVLCCSL